MTEYEKALRQAGIVDWRDHYGIGGLGCAAPGLPTVDRYAWVRRFGFAVPNDEAIRVIGGYGPVLEVGAGCGCWAKELTRAGVDVVATDPHPPPTESNVDGADYSFDRQLYSVERLDGLTALEKYPGRSLLMVWPCYFRPWPAEVLRAYRGEVVCYVGEGEGGCTGNDEFHGLLNWHFREIESVTIPQWRGLHDLLYVYRRKREGEQQGKGK